MLPNQIPMYADMLLSGYTDEDVIRAGYFQDNYTSPSEINTKIISNYNDSLYHCASILKPTMILSISGCFSPIHAGHISALTTAKEYYESLGHKVMGVIIPANDSYVNNKRQGTCKCPAIERIIKIKKYLETHSLDWIVIDEHPALALDKELNFPFLLERLHLLFPKVELGFVFGSDNSDFVLALSHTNFHSIIVNRNDDITKIKESILNIKNSYNKYYIVEDNDYSELSSTSIRNNTKEKIKPNMVYMIRDDSSLINNGVHVYTGKLIVAELSKIFSKIGVKPIVMDIDEQLDVFKSYMKNTYKNPIIISMDKYFKGTFQFNVSRLFNLFSYQKQCKGLYYKNIKALETFLGTLPLNETIILVDDDISTGYTINNVKELILSIRDDLTIKTEFINEVYLASIGIDKEFIYDIVDIRDFIFNTSNGGLMTQRGASKPSRFTYVYPYINLYTRAKIPYSEILPFTNFIYSVNINK